MEEIVPAIRPTNIAKMNVKIDLLPMIRSMMTGSIVVIVLLMDILIVASMESFVTAS